MLDGSLVEVCGGMEVGGRVEDGEGPRAVCSVTTCR